MTFGNNGTYDRSRSFCFKLGQRCIRTYVSNFATNQQLWFDNVRAWSRTFTDFEIVDDMRSAEANTTNLVGSWDGTLDSNGNLKDFSDLHNDGVFHSGISKSINCTVNSNKGSSSIPPTEIIIIASAVAFFVGVCAHYIIFQLVAVVAAVIIYKRTQKNNDTYLFMKTLTDVIILDCLGEGSFGEVYRGSWEVIVQ